MKKWIDFAQKSTAEILNQFNTSENGLDNEEIKKRLKKFGLNKITTFKINLIEIIKRNALNFFNVFLFFAGFLSFLIKGFDIETVLILLFLFLSILIAVWQDYRVNKLSEKLLSYFKNYAFAKRNGKWQQIETEYLVPGDYVKISAGYLIPADIRILKAEDALVDESIVTGESEPIYKNSEPSELTQNLQKNKNTELTERTLNPQNFSASSTPVQLSSVNNSASSASVQSSSVIPENIALLGTTLIKGEIEGIVLATGKESYFGSIAKKTIEIDKKTAYQKMMNQFAKNIAFVAIFLTLIIILINLLKPGYPNFQELIIFSIVLAVAIVPEFLPTMTVLTLSLAGVRLAKRGLIIKRLSSIEDLGAIEILCTDKTGTITTNELKLERIITMQNYTEQTQSLQNNIQNFPEQKQNEQKDFNTENTELTQNLRKGSASSESVLSSSEFIKYFLLDYYFTQEATPYEKAILEKVKKLPNYSNFELIEDSDFDPVKRIRKIIVKENGLEIEIIKGAPENVLEYCFGQQSYTELTQNFQKKHSELTQNSQKSSDSSASVQSVLSKYNEEYYKWLKIFENEDKDGLRTLGLAIKVSKKRIYANNKGRMGANNSLEFESDSHKFAIDSPEFVFLGIASFVDPLKETAFSAINLAKRLNLEIKILTGDSLNVARSVGLKLGLINKNEKVVLGEEIRNLNEEEIKKIVKETKIFARVLPEDKLRIIEALQKEKFVAFLGEGINDAPALKIANVALAVDNATDVVKQEADIILKEKDLKTIVDGIYQGRKVLENIGKYIKHTMSDNFGNLTSVALLTSVLPFVPMTPLQVLLTNFLTDIPLIAFANDNVEIKELKKPIKISSYHLILLLLGLGLVAGVINIIGYLIVKNQPTEVIRTYIFLLTTITGLLVSFLIRTKNWFFLSKPGKSFLIASVIGLILTLVFIFIPPFNSIFEFSNLNQKLLILSIILMLFFTLGTEIVKKIFYHKFPDVI
jgi:Mg2+-importing ATPase